jgi:phosphoribosyl-ATP pyrophosphohydrolase
MNVVARLYALVLERKASARSDSYVCKLLQAGEDRMLQKIGEEAVEAILAAKTGSEEALVKEFADLTFHALVLLGSRGIPPERIAQELERRFGTSGLAEKAARTANPP